MLSSRTPKIDHFQCLLWDNIPKNIEVLMVSYINSVKKHESDTHYIAFKFYNNIVVPSWVEFDPCPKRGIIEENIKLSNKVSMI